jgi:orotidine-5'-phosphate decarboxylase
LAHNETHLVVPAGSHVGSVVGLAAELGMRPHLFVPGITASGGELQALSAVASRVAGIYPIVGRAVVAAADPAAAAAALVSALTEAVAAGGGIR